MSEPERPVNPAYDETSAPHAHAKSSAKVDADAPTAQMPAQPIDSQPIDASTVAGPSKTGPSVTAPSVTAPSVTAPLVSKSVGAVDGPTEPIAVPPVDKTEDAGAAGKPTGPAETRPEPTAVLPVGDPSATGVGEPPILLSPVPEENRGRTLLVMTTIVALLFAMASAGMSYAFVNRLDAYQKQVGIVSQRNSTISSQQRQLNDLKSQLQSAQSQINQLQQQAAGSANQVTQLTQGKAALSKCIHSINDFFAIVADGGTAAAQSAAQDKMQADCTAAQQYLD